MHKLALPLIERESTVPAVPLSGSLQVPPCTLNGFIPEADAPDKGTLPEHRIAGRKSLPGYSGSSGGLLKTVGRRDAAIERTGMYLQRVLSNPPLGSE
jgi:hypothetical protein